MKYSHITYPRLVPDQYQSPVFQPLFKTWRYRYRKLLRATYNWNYLLYWCTPETHYVIMKDLICLEIFFVASIKGLKDTFTTSTIYGADVDKKILFSEERIKTFFVDQNNLETFKNITDNVKEEYDLIILIYKK